MVVQPAKPADNQTAWNCHASNPSPVVLPSGNILLMYRGTPCDLAGAACNSAWECVRQGIAEAPSYRGEFVKRPEPLALASTSEDPFFWQSKRGFHLLTHSWRTCGEPVPGTPDRPNPSAGSCGAYSWSEDSQTWTSSSVPFYQAAVHWVNGSTTELRARQRPQILFDSETAAPMFLFNGATSIEAGAGRSWTMAVPFKPHTPFKSDESDPGPWFDDEEPPAAAAESLLPPPASVASVAGSAPAPPIHGGTPSSASGEPIELWAVPQQQGSLHAAVAAAAQHPGPATIHLAPGRHVLTAPLVLDARHSGTRFVGHGGASVSGAHKISDWSIVGPAKCSGCSTIWKARVPKGVDSRQLYVNGVRANRTWVPFSP